MWLALGLACCLAFGGRAQAQAWVLDTPYSLSVQNGYDIAMFDTGHAVLGGNRVAWRTGTGSWSQVYPMPIHDQASVTAIKGTPYAWAAGYDLGTNYVYRTSDYGASWTSKSTGLVQPPTWSGPYYLDVSFRDTLEGLAVGEAGLISYTSNGGDTWTTILAGTSADLVRVHCAGNIWYILGDHVLLTFTPSAGIGNITAASPDVAAAYKPYLGFHFLDDMTGFIHADKLYRTTNGAATWDTIPRATQTPPARSIFFHTALDGWMIGENGCPAHTTDGGQTWRTHRTSFGAFLHDPVEFDFADTRHGLLLAHHPYSPGYIPNVAGMRLVDAPQIRASQIDFGTIVCGSGGITHFTIWNYGNLPLDIPAGGIVFPGSTCTVTYPTLPYSVPAGDSVTVLVQWSPGPSFSGTLADTCLITSNDPTTLRERVPVSGRRMLNGAQFDPVLTFPRVCQGQSLDSLVTVTPLGMPPPRFLGWRVLAGDAAFSIIAPAPGTELTAATDFTVRFTPVHSGPHHADVELSIGDSACPSRRLLSCYGAAFTEQMTVEPRVVDFGEVCIGSSRDTLLTLRNDGDVPLELTRWVKTSGSDAFIPDMTTPGVQLDSGVSMSVRVTYITSTRDTGSVSARHIVGFSGCRADSLPLHFAGRAVQNALMFTPSTHITLGPASPGDTLYAPLLLRRVGNGRVYVDSLILGGSRDGIDILHEPALPFAFGDSLALTVRYARARAGLSTAQLTVVWSGPCGGRETCTIQGQSTEPPRIDVAAQQTFRAQTCPAAVRDSVLVRNAGAGVLELRQYHFEGPDSARFRIVTPVFPVRVHQGDSVRLLIQFQAQVNGKNHSELVLLHNDAAAGGSTRISLTAQRDVPELRLEGDTVTVLRRCVGGMAARSFLLRNTSTTMRTIRAITLRAGADVFSLGTPPMPSVVQQGAALAFSVTFRPKMAGAAATIIGVLTAECPDTMFIRLAGNGERNGIIPDHNICDFAAVRIGSSRTATVRFRNTGVMDQQIDTMWLDAGTAPCRITPVTYPAAIAAGSIRDWTLEYQPVQKEQLWGVLYAVVRAPCNDTLHVSVTGRAVLEELAFTRDSITLVLDPCGMTGLCDTVRLANLSSRAIVLTSIACIPGDVLRVTPSVPVPMTLAAGTQLAMLLCAEAGFTGTRHAVLRIGTADSGVAPIELPVLLRRDSVSFTATPAPLNFGVTTPGDSTQETCSVRNHSDRPLRLLPPILMGAGSVFRAVPQDTMWIAARDSQTVAITYRPLAHGDDRATLALVADSPCTDTVYIQLYGSARGGNDAGAAPHPGALALVVTPQPVRGTARLSWTLPAAGPVELRITDILGRAVYRLYDEWARAGAQTVGFDTREIPAGIYIATLRWEGEQHTVLLLHAK